MQVTKEVIEPCTVSLTITVDAETVDRGFARAYREFAAVTNVPGFRPGKAPRAVLERYLDPARVRERVSEIVAVQAFREAAKQEDIHPYDESSVEFGELNPGQDWEFKVVVSLPPTVELGNLEGLQVERPVYTVSDADVDSEIERIRRDRARMTPVEGRPVQADDWVIGDLAIAMEGVEEPEEPRRSLVRLGGNIPGFDEAVIGQEIGEERVFTLTYPEDYQEADRAGKQATFRLKVTSIRERRLPDLTDEWVREISDAGSVEEFRSKMRQAMEARIDEMVDDLVQSRIVQAVMDRSKIEYPVAMLREQASREMMELRERLQGSNLTYEQYLETEGLTEEQHREQVAESADRHVRSRLILQELARSQNLVVTDEEVDAEFRRIFADADEADPGVKRIAQSDKRREQVANIVLQRKLRDCLYSIATIVDAPEKPQE